jgi:hypothetical protein
MARKKAKEQTTPAVENETAAGLDLANMPVEIDGKEYILSFAFSDLAEAERFFQRKGKQFHLIFALPDLSLESIRVVFPCAAHTHHSELSWEAAQALVTMQSVYPIATAIRQAWDAESAKVVIPAAK